jgi:hypothetical protein
MIEVSRENAELIEVAACEHINRFYHQHNTDNVANPNQLFF